PKAIIALSPAELDVLFAGVGVWAGPSDQATGFGVANWTGASFGISAGLTESSGSLDSIGSTACAMSVRVQKPATDRTQVRARLYNCFRRIAWAFRESIAPATY